MRKINILNIIFVVVLTSLSFCIGFELGKYYPNKNSLQTIPLFSRRVLDKYSIPALTKLEIPTGKLTLEEFEKGDNYNRATFNFEYLPQLSGDTKQTSGEVRMPEKSGKYPLVIMFRGYVDETIYETGLGTRNASIYLTQNGFITLAPDFLGYANSDEQAENIFESRFQTYTLALSLINTVKSGQLPTEIKNVWDGTNIFIWAHSNGGQIALTALEVVNYTIPTALWAPVSKPFPYSILYYTDDSQDGGKYIRNQLADFEKIYNTNRYSLVEFLDQIDSPILLQQGTQDSAVPIAWSNLFNLQLRKLNKEIEYKIYNGADHNFRPLWNEAMSDTLNFYNSKIVETVL